MNIKLKKFAVFSFTGSIEIYNINEIQEKIIPLIETEKDVIFDMSEVEYVDSSGIGFLIKVKKKLNKLILINPNPSVRQLISMTDLGNFFIILNSLEDTLDKIPSKDL